MIVNKYVKQIALFTYLLRKPNKFYVIFVARANKYLHTFSLEKIAHILGLCKVLCLFHLCCHTVADITFNSVPRSFAVLSSRIKIQSVEVLWFWNVRFFNIEQGWRINTPWMWLADDHLSRSSSASYFTCWSSVQITLMLLLPLLSPCFWWSFIWLIPPPLRKCACFLTRASKKRNLLCLLPPSPQGHIQDMLS